MQTAIWKFLALSGVIGLGCLVVYQVHVRIPMDGPGAVGLEQFNALEQQTESDESATSPVPDGLKDPGQQPRPSDESEVVAEPPLLEWDPVASQNEPASAPAADIAASDFWSPGPTGDVPADNAPAGFPPQTAPTSADETGAAPVSQLDVAQLPTPGGPHAPTPTEAAAALDTSWTLIGQVEPGPAATSPPSGDVLPKEFDVDPALADSEAGAPGPFDPPAESQPLPTVEEFAREQPPGHVRPVSDDAAAPFADDKVKPAAGVEHNSSPNPFGDESETTTAQDAPTDRPAPLVLDFTRNSEPPQQPGPGNNAVDPFSGFTPEPSEAPAVMPADPQDAGFGAAPPPAQLPKVDANPFASPPQQNDESQNPFGGPPLPPTDRVQDSPDTGAGAGNPFGTDNPFGNVMPEEQRGPQLSAEPLEPVNGSSDGSTDSRSTSSGNPTPTEWTFDSSGPSDATPTPVVVDDEDAPPPVPLENLPSDRSPGEAGDAPVPPLDLTGDATVGTGVASGAQQPKLEIRKIAPPESTIGEPLIYAIQIRNVGQSDARGVVVEDRIPRGTTLEGTIPQAELTDKVLTWRLGTISPGDEKTIRIKVVPSEAGEIGSVATVRFAAEVVAATNITSADLHLDTDGPGEIAVGETGVIHYRLTNSGNGTARGAYIRCQLPAGLEHPGGSDIEYEVGDLPPGASRTVELSVRAAVPGAQRGRTLLNAGGRTYDTSELIANVLPSRLAIGREGPKRRFVGRPADYTTVVTNRSTNTLSAITVVEQLPQGLELASIPEDGTYDPQERTMTWLIPTLSAGQSFAIHSSMVGRECGLHTSSIVARDRAGHEARLSSDLQVAGFSTLEVNWEHESGPVAVGEQVALRMTVRNEGTAPAENVQAVFEVPAQMEFVNADGPVPFQREGRLIRFNDLDELAIDGEQSFDIVLTAAAPGNTKVSAQLRTADHEEPLRHDEPVYILQDEN